MYSFVATGRRFNLASDLAVELYCDGVDTLKGVVDVVVVEVVVVASFGGA